MRIAVLSMLLTLAGAAETSVAPPSIGFVRDCDGRVREVFGGPGAFLLGPPRAAQSAALLRAPEGAKMEGRTLILRDAAGVEKRVPLPEPAGPLQRIGDGWLAAAPFAIRLAADGAIVYRLPMKACGGRFAEDGR